ncbi:hypothetical protein GCM10027075_55390 [Streptomyces heilongjiangensis]
MATTTRIGPAATPITASMKRLHPSVTEHGRHYRTYRETRTYHYPPHRPCPPAIRFAEQPPAPHTGEVNERYLQHPATGSFAVETEGEITQWDTFAAHRFRSRSTRRGE